MPFTTAAVTPVEEVWPLIAVTKPVKSVLFAMVAEILTAVALEPNKLNETVPPAENEPKVAVVSAEAVTPVVLFDAELIACATVYADEPAGMDAVGIVSVLPLPEITRPVVGAAE